MIGVGVLRGALAFGLGLAGGIVVLAVLTYAYPELWLPVAFGGLGSGLMFLEPWAVKRGIVWPLSIGLIAAVTSGWFATATGSSRQIDVMFGPSLIFLPIVGGAFLVFVVVQWRMPAKQRRAGWWMLVTVTMAYIVSMASSSVGGAGRMVTFLTHYLHMSLDDAHQVVHIVRKSIHFSFYGFLGCTARNAAANAGEKMAVVLRYGLLWTLLVASFDEFRQSSQPGRNGSIYDVMLDMAGAIVFLAILTWFASKSQGSRKLSS